ncbi:hypothetical protein [Krasilnikovia sp. MM14-A1004]|uniref:hypothetical protein n=1 Tax=Krasilnikovia sp. MM14-A1004 TaxID=3373541 RepID=UPI00399C5A1E
MTDNHPDQAPGSEPGSFDNTSTPGPIRPPSPFAEWAGLSQPASAPPRPVTPAPVGQPPHIRPPVLPGPPPPEQGPAADRVFYRAPLAYPAPPTPFPPGLSPTTDDPLVSVDFNGWWNRSFRLLRAVWRQAALVQLLWAGPIVVAGVLASVFHPSTFTHLSEPSAEVQPDWRPLVRSLYYLVPIGVLIGLLGLLASLATLHLVVQAAVGRPPSVRHALRTAGPRVPAYIGWGLLGGLLTMAGFVCCILPGYYVSTVVLILPTVVLLERGRAVARCFRLFHARPGDALARLATIIGLTIAISVVEQAFVLIVIALLGPFSTDLTAGAAFLAGSIIAIAFSAASQVVLAPMNVTAYADMRARHEPFSTAHLIT